MHLKKDELADFKRTRSIRGLHPLVLPLGLACGTQVSAGPSGPDGTKIVYTRSDAVSLGETVWSVNVVNPDGTQATQAHQDNSAEVVWGDSDTLLHSCEVSSTDWNICRAELEEYCPPPHWAVE